NEQLYMAIARQSSEMALWEQTQTGLGRVVDNAVEPVRPVRPRKPLVWLIGLVLGTSLALGYIFIREISSSEINSVEKLKKAGPSVLAVVPDMKPIIDQEFKGKEYYSVRGADISTSLLMLLDPISPVAESIRRLQSNLIYAEPDNPLNTILITSANKGEGKSTVSTNLAVAMAEAGKRVLLIDCDFRRNRVHRVLGLNESPGITELLFDETTKGQSIRPTVIPNVFALTTGKRPPNPAALSRSQKLKALILELQDEFDHIIIDSAPYGIITDGAPLIQLSDAVVVVVRFNETSQSELAQSLENLRNIRANVVGTVLLGYDHKKSSGYYYTDNYYKHAYKRYYEYTAKG
ncbi:MAG: polysaccharide biosynthesis tyrosine autokinase, partial [Cyclonatronaceae bacterium]